MADRSDYAGTFTKGRDEVMDKRHIELGRRVKDGITGFAGIAISRTEYLYGNPRIAVCSETLKDGKTISETFDERRLEYHGDPKKVSGFSQQGGAK